MRIKINEKFYLATDPMNFIIIKKEKKTFKNIAYFGKLEQALNRLLDMSLMESEILTLSELKAEIQKARDEIKGLIARLKEEGFETARTDAFYKKQIKQESFAGVV
ncbi:MAG: hypothetical protein JXA79_03705 [Deltaproteobacteria bacterium]|nr:hypothetical protein [Deltaproteobacteria bacterium]